MSEGRLGEEEAFRVLDVLRFFSAAKKDVGLKLWLQLSTERGLGSGRMGEGTSWRVSLGEAESGDPPGARRAEQVSATAGADLSAAVGVKNKHRCSGSWRQMLDREEKVNVHMFSYRSIHRKSRESNRVIYVKPLYESKYTINS